MHYVRALCRLVIFFLLSVPVLILVAGALILNRNDTQRQNQWKNMIISRWARMVARLIGCKMHIEGRLPKPPFFLVSNHLSYLDILPYWSFLQTTFIAKSDIRRWPFFGKAARLLGIIFINRQRRKDLTRVNRLIEQHLQEGEGIVLFPEGTSSKGAKVLPFRSSLLFYPAENGMPVHYASISYTVDSPSDACAWKTICWWGDMDFFPHLWRLLQIKKWRVHVYFGSEPLIQSNRKTLSMLLHQNVAESFKPTHQRAVASEN